MKTSEWLREHYNEAIEYMKRADAEAMESPHCQFAVIFDKDREEDYFDIHTEAAGSNFYRVGWEYITEYCYQNNPIQDTDDRSYEQIYKDDLYNRLKQEDKDAIAKYIQKYYDFMEITIDEYDFYDGLVDHIRHNYEYAYEAYLEDLIKSYKENIPEDYYTDRLDWYIKECEYEEKMEEW